MDTNNNNNNKQCECNKPKVVNDLLKRISNLEFDVEDKQREIESLKQINEEHKKINGELRIENDRLNDIINELEKDLEDRYYGRGKYAMDSDVIGIIEVLSKLQELKGSDK